MAYADVAAANPTVQITPQNIRSHRQVGAHCSSPPSCHIPCVRRVQQLLDNLLAFVSSCHARRQRVVPKRVMSIVERFSEPFALGLEESEVVVEMLDVSLDHSAQGDDAFAIMGALAQERVVG